MYLKKYSFVTEFKNVVKNPFNYTQDVEDIFRNLILYVP